MADKLTGEGIWGMAGDPGEPCSPENSSGGLPTSERVRLGLAESVGHAQPLRVRGRQPTDLKCTNEGEPRTANACCM